MHRTFQEKFVSRNAMGICCLRSPSEITFCPSYVGTKPLWLAMGTSDSTRQEQSSQSSRSPWVRPARWGMGSSATANNSPIPSLPSALCAPPKPSNSSSTCRTSSPSPRLRETEDESAAVASPGFGFGRRREGSPSRGPTPQPQHTSAASADTSWGQFDGPPGPASCGSSGRELQRRKCTFRVFVVFRGGWCTTSHSLLRGKLIVYAWVFLSLFTSLE